MTVGQQQITSLESLVAIDVVMGAPDPRRKREGCCGFTAPAGVLRRAQRFDHYARCFPDELYAVCFNLRRVVCAEYR
jgi:hypothetical protein